MSRSYRMDFQIDLTNLDQENNISLIEDIIDKNWCIDDQWVDNNTFYLSGDNKLCGGVTEEEFTSEITRELWETVGKFFSITIKATYLDEIPYESYTFDQREYALMFD